MEIRKPSLFVKLYSATHIVFLRISKKISSFLPPMLLFLNPVSLLLVYLSHFTIVLEAGSGHYDIIIHSYSRCV